MSELGKILIIFGVIIAAVGVMLVLAGKVHIYVAGRTAHASQQEC